ncbi:hypothetical protein DL766_002530 [Monosporascus sp. MC13-8B]|uniref:S1-like domain-containing protein n=1 Tax=Monosporascus cannonballus TaxID=155416 RepID=A0ABY0GRS3_9PEZI|nr:hypothetical protein DL762_009981 [Monosporascus cannonballus]RYP01034.1 hypothetical protein DL763_000455 [Monosporascus cannonballus]RYP35354.1 hypothetical protein DL766_002530 [Monosporascus sp. MC13-8B]
MGRPKRDIRAAAEATTTPPDQLSASQSIAKIIKAEGNNLYSCSLPDNRTVLVELAARFRNTIWIKRGGFVLVDLTPAEDHKGKVEGEIVNVVREEREWRKKSYWPKEFAKPTLDDDDSEEESNVGKMPPSDSEDED